MIINNVTYIPVWNKQVPVREVTFFNMLVDYVSRRQYEQYVCKRIPGKQAVVVMACDNTHIRQGLNISPPSLSLSIT
jgi:hypothetical protein